MNGPINRLLITGTPENHQRVEELIKALDVGVSKEQSPIRFYKLAGYAGPKILFLLPQTEWN